MKYTVEIREKDKPLKSFEFDSFIDAKEFYDRRRTEWAQARRRGEYVPLAQMGLGDEKFRTISCLSK